MLPIEAAREVVAKWLLLDNLDVVDILLATVASNLTPGDPVWLLLVGPPSSAKSELIRGLSRYPRIYPLESLTSHTFVSGMKQDEQSSLLLRLPNPCVLAMKDFGIVLTRRPEEKAEILQQLREIYDGKFSKHYGTGEVVRWEGKVGFIGGVTPAIERHTSVIGELGNRFLFYHLTSKQRSATAHRAIEVAGQELEMRNEIADAFQAALVGITRHLPAATLPPRYQAQLTATADFVTRCRTPVARNRQDKSILYEPELEGPARLAKALYHLARGLAVVRNHQRIGLDEIITIHEIALSSMPQLRRKLLAFLGTANRGFTIKEVSLGTHLPTTTVRLLLENLTLLGAVTIETDPQNPTGTTWWKLSSVLKQTIEKANIALHSLPGGER